MCRNNPKGGHPCTRVLGSRACHASATLLGLLLTVAPARAQLQPRIDSVDFTLNNQLEVYVEVPPGYRSACLEVIPDASHCPQYENADAWRDVIERHLARI